MDEDLRGTVDFDFFEDVLPYQGTINPSPHPLVTGKPPTPVKYSGWSKESRLFEKIGNDQNNLIFNDDLHKRNGSLPILSSDKSTGDESFRQNIPLENVSNNNMNLFKDVKNEYNEDTADFVDDFESDQDVEIVYKSDLSLTNEKNCDISPLSVAIPSISNSNIADTNQNCDRTFLVSSSSSAYSQSEQSTSEDNSDAENYTKHKRRNVTFFTTRDNEHLSGRISRLSNYDDRRQKSKQKFSKKGKLKSKIADHTNHDKAKAVKKEISDDHVCSDSEISSSEITDVSPLSSSEDSSKECRSEHRGTIDYRDCIKDQAKNKKCNSSVNLHRKRDSMEFKLLMQAVHELDNEKKHKTKGVKKCSALDSSLNVGHDRNYSFSDHQCKMIEQENQRLLNEISKKHLSKSPHSGELLQRRLPSSAVNRYKEQRKIEIQNMEFLKRLGNIKPTKGLTRDEQLSEYNKRIRYGTRTVHREGWGIPSRRSTSLTGSVCDESSAVNSNVDSSSIYSGNSASSVKSRSSSASRRWRMRSKPAWEHRW